MCVLWQLLFAMIMAANTAKRCIDMVGVLLALLFSS